MGTFVKGSRRTPYAFLMFYGAPGIGKTPMAAYWAKELSTLGEGKGRVLYIDLDFSLTSVPKDVWGDFITFHPDMQQNGAIIKPYVQMTTEVLPKLMKGEFDVCVLDGITALGASILDDVKSIAYTPAGKDGGKKDARLSIPMGTGQKEWGIPSQTDYRAAQGQVAEIIGALRRCPCHTIVNAHEKMAQYKEPNGEKEVKGGPWFVGAEPTFSLPAWFDACYYLRYLDKSRGGGQWYKERALCTTQPPNVGTNYVVKDRIGGLQDIEPNPDALTLFNKVRPRFEALIKSAKED